jgi:hypothetical protein
VTLGEKTYRLGDELDRLDEELDELQERLRDAEPGTASADVIRERANQLDMQGSGVAYLVAEYGADATVTMRGLPAGVHAAVEDIAADLRAERSGAGGAPGSATLVFAAAGVVDAPFLPDPEDGEEPDGVEAEIRHALAVVSQQPTGVAKWLEARANELTAVDEGNWRSFSERLVANSEG